METEAVTNARMRVRRRASLENSERLSVESVYISPQELAKRWGISISKAYALQGTLPALRIGGNIRFPFNAVLEYEREHRSEARAS